jgi:hypothetical protein
MWMPTDVSSAVASPAGAAAGAGTVGARLRAKVPADLDAPDKVAFDLTFRQVSVLTVAGLTALTVWAISNRLLPMLPAPARAVALVPIAGIALALALGRRDGLPLDAWLTAAAVFRTRPGRLTSTPVHDPPGWAPAPPPANRREREPVMGLLRLPADAVDADGTIRHRDRATSTATLLVAASTVNIQLRTPTEQAALVAGLGRWLNGLTGSVQIVVSTRRVDLPGHAIRLLDRAHHLANGPRGFIDDLGADDPDAEGLGADDVGADDPDAIDLGADQRAAHTPRGHSLGAQEWHGHSALAAAAIDHAEFLLELAQACDPVERTVTIAATACGGPSPATVARRTAEHTVAGLSAVGAQTQILDGATATAVLATVGDPYQAGDPGWPRTRPGAAVTGRVGGARVMGSR